MNDMAQQRADVVNRLSEALREDDRIAGAILVGSGATGFVDDASDIDLAAPVLAGSDAAHVFDDWKGRVEHLLGVRYYADTAFTEAHHLMVLLCDGGLEVDLSFPALNSLAPLTPHWRVLWERTDEVTRRMSHTSETKSIDEKRAYIWALNRGVHRAIYAAKALRRGQLWKGMLLLDELRCRTLQLASLNIFGTTYSDILGPDGIERHADHLPHDLLTAIARTLPARADLQSLRASLDACAGIMLQQAAALDARYGVERSERLAAILDERFALTAETDHEDEEHDEA